jgi:hypothetical protein
VKWNPGVDGFAYLGDGGGGGGGPAAGGRTRGAGGEAVHDASPNSSSSGHGDSSSVESCEYIDPTGIAETACSSARLDLELHLPNRR